MRSLNLFQGFSNLYNGSDTYCTKLLSLMKQYISMWVLTHLLALTPQLSLGSTVLSEIVDGPSHVRNLGVTLRQWVDRRNFFATIFEHC